MHIGHTNIGLVLFHSYQYDIRAFVFIIVCMRVGVIK